jgi:hypothetical protein
MAKLPTKQRNAIGESENFLMKGFFGSDRLVFGLGVGRHQHMKQYQLIGNNKE